MRGRDWVERTQHNQIAGLLPVGVLGEHGHVRSSALVSRSPGSLDVVNQQELLIGIQIVTETKSNDKVRDKFTHIWKLDI